MRGPGRPEVEGDSLVYIRVMSVHVRPLATRGRVGQTHRWGVCWARFAQVRSSRAVVVPGAPGIALLVNAFVPKTAPEVARQKIVLLAAAIGGWTRLAARNDRVKRFGNVHGHIVGAVVQLRQPPQVAEHQVLAAGCVRSGLQSARGSAVHGVGRSSRSPKSVRAALD